MVVKGLGARISGFYELYFTDGEGLRPTDKLIRLSELALKQEKTIHELKEMVQEMDAELKWYVQENHLLAYELDEITKRALKDQEDYHKFIGTFNHMRQLLRIMKARLERMENLKI